VHHVLEGDVVACSAGANFTPHIIIVAPDEVWIYMLSMVCTTVVYTYSHLVISGSEYFCVLA
jgi:hypothetical protein